MTAPDLPRLAALAALACAATAAIAQAPYQYDNKLPPSPDYIGEIRRGPDGQLRTVPAPAAEPAPAAAMPATALGPGQKVIRVGDGDGLISLAEAARLARDGDIVEIAPGSYRRQPVVWTQKRLTIRGVGERPGMVADGASAEGKAIWVIRHGDFTVDNIEFRGARVADGNGAGIRFERGSLRLKRCAFFDNEMGLLAGNNADSTLEISDSEFGQAPRHDGPLHHLLYVGAIGKFSLTGSRFSGGYRGHLVKSRARDNFVAYNLLVDGPAGKASYELEFPNGGIAYVIGNVIGQSAGTDNPTLVAYGAEGPRWPENALYLAHNTLINDLHHGNFVFAWADKLGPATEVWAINNLLVGYGNLDPAPHGRFEGNPTVSRAALIETGGVPLRLTTDSPLRGSVRTAGMAGARSLVPQAEFVFPVGSRPLQPPSRVSPGAFQ